MNTVSKKKKKYIVNLSQVRSRRALLAALAVSVCTFVAVVEMVIMNIDKESAFHYFTVVSNLLSAAGAMLMLPYAVEGIRRKRFTFPRWISLFQYAGAVSVSITMFCACTIITFTLGPQFAFGRANIWLHLVTPVCAIILFLAVESGRYLTKKDTVIAQLPFWGYAAVYIVMVIVIGKDKGGWNDIYQTMSRLPLWVVFLMLITIGYAVAVLLRVIHNRTVTRGIRQLRACWQDDITPVEMKVEAFGLGRYMGSHLDQSEVTIPMDLLKLMSEKSGVPVEALARAYVKGVTDSISIPFRESVKQQSGSRFLLSGLFAGKFLDLFQRKTGIK